MKLDFTLTSAQQAALDAERARYNSGSVEQLNEEDYTVQVIVLPFLDSLDTAAIIQAVSMLSKEELRIVIEEKKKPKPVSI